MATAFKVVGSLAILRTEAGPDRYLYQGAVVGEGFTKESVAHAISVGLVEEIDLDAASEAEKVEFPSKDWNHAQIDAWAGDLDPAVTFDPAEKLTKEQKIEALASQIEAAKAAVEQSTQQ